MKKQICFLLVIVLTILSVFTIDLPVRAQTPGIRISYESQDVKKGDIVSIPVNIQNNAGIMGVGLNISYDKNIFELVSVSKGDVLEKGIFNTSLQEGKDPDGNVKVLWSNTDAIKLNGTLMTLVVRVKNDVISGQYNIGITGSEGDTFDDAYNDLNIISECGDINIVAADAIIVSGQSDEVLGGTEITIPISFTKNTGIMGFKISVSYNGFVLNTPEVERGDILSVGTFNNSISDNTKDSFDILWSNTDNIQKDGIAFYLKFKAEEVDAAKDAEINLTYSQPDTFNENFDDVNLAIQTISLKILAEKELQQYKEEYKKKLSSDFAVSGLDDGAKKQVDQIIKETQNIIEGALGKGEMSSAIEEARKKIDEISNKENEKVALCFSSGLDDTKNVTQRYEIGTEIVLNDNGYTREGYSLKGWNDGKKEYTLGEIYIVPDFDVILTAVWSKITAPVPSPSPSPKPVVPVSTSKYQYEKLADGTIRITSCQTKDVNLVIPDTIDGYTVTEIGESAFANQSSIQTIKFPANLKQIGAKAFAKCTGLTEVTLPDTIVGVGKFAFSGCIALKKATLNNGRINIVVGMFANCIALSEVVIPDTVENINIYAFLNCKSLKNLKLPASIKEISISAFDGAGITTVTYAGTREQWKKIKKTLTGNASLAKATITDSTGVSFAANGTDLTPAASEKVKKPAKAKITKAQNVKARKLTVKWKKVAKVKGYQIQIAANKKFTKGKKTKTSGKTNYTFKGLKKNKYYYIRVRAYVYDNSYKKVYGSWSSTKKVKIKK